MVSVNTNLNNYSYWEILHEIFEGYPPEFVYTATGIFRQNVPPLCVLFGSPIILFQKIFWWGKRFLLISLENSIVP